MNHGLVWVMTRAGGDERAFFVWGEAILIIRKRGPEANFELEGYEFPTAESAGHSLISATAALEDQGFLLVIAPTVVDVRREDVADRLKGDTDTLWARVRDLVWDAKVAV